MLGVDTVCIKGIGPNRIQSLGCFHQKVLVDDEEVTLKFHVIPEQASSFKAIIGNDILSQASVTINGSEIRLSTKSEENFMMNITLEESQTDHLNLDHIPNVDERKCIAELINNYTPNKIKSTDIKMKIILKNEEPVYQRPRRLSTVEKMEVDRQIEEWLEEGIV